MVTIELPIAFLSQGVFSEECSEECHVCEEFCFSEQFLEHFSE